MKLPNREKAHIPPSKLRDYLLSETHVVGRGKAKFFRMFGFDETNADLLEQGLIAIAHNETSKRRLYHRTARSTLSVVRYKRRWVVSLA
jgi:hypothetical protein